MNELACLNNTTNKVVFGFFCDDDDGDEDYQLCEERWSAVFG